MSKIDEVAKAISKSHGLEIDWDTLTERGKQVWRRDARAAITAMREPSEEMKQAGYDAFVASKLPNGIKFLDAWKAMTDEYL